MKDEARRLLEQGRIGMQPPAGARERVFKAVVAPPPSIAPAPGPSTALGIKVAIAAGIGGIVLAGIAGAFWLHARSHPPQSAPVLASSTVVEIAAPPESSSAAPEPAPAETETAPAPAPKASVRVAPSSSADSLAEELGLLRDAQSALRAGNAARALTLLDQHAARYPKSAFTQERLATRIQALCRLGRTSEAAQLFARLSASNPNSPHLAALKRSCPALDSKP